MSIATFPQAAESGQLTPEQQRRVMAAVRKESAALFYVVGSLAVMFGVIVWLGAGAARTSLSGPASSAQDPASFTFYLVCVGLLLVAVLGLVLLAARLVWQLQEVRAGRMDRAIGHVVWERGAYRAHVAGRTLNLMGFDLAAGTYNFGYLPRSARVVVADLATLDSPAEARDALRHALALATHFNLDDVPDYRRGHLKHVGRHLRRIWAAPGWLLFVGILALFTFVFVVAGDPNSGWAPLTFILAALAGIIGLILALAAMGPTRDVLAGRVISVDGMAQKSVRQVSTGRGSTMVYSVYVGGQTWRVSPEAYQALLPNLNYTVYYLPKSKRLLAIEPGA